VQEGGTEFARLKSVITLLLQNHLCEKRHKPTPTPRSIVQDGFQDKTQYHQSFHHLLFSRSIPLLQIHAYGLLLPFISGSVASNHCSWLYENTNVWRTSVLLQSHRVCRIHAMSLGGSCFGTRLKPANESWLSDIDQDLCARVFVACVW